MRPFVSMTGRVIYMGLLVCLVLIAISNTGLVKPNWPFELFATFMRQVLPIVVLSICVALNARKGVSALFLLVFGVLAFWPLFPGSKYVKSDPGICKNSVCFTVIFANLRRKPGAFNTVKMQARKQSADLIALSELPPEMTSDLLSKYLSDYPYILFYDHADDGRKLGSVKAIASRFPLGPSRLIAEDYPNFPRSIIHVPFLTDQGEIDFFLTHPRIPLAHAGMRRRDAVISMLKSEIGASENFVIVGDFNLAPWAPAFRNIPGRRAGDPRWESTWKDGFLPFGVPIDHALIGTQIDLGESDVLPRTGSDHRPILIRFKKSI